MQQKTDTLIVCSCDQNYFPLLKGLILSILDNGPLDQGLGLGFVDIGCEPWALEWLLQRNVRVRTPGFDIMGRLADRQLGYHRSLVCRPFLPLLFPEADRLIWIDCDTWVQDISIFAALRTAVTKDPDKLLITPECHYSYISINENFVERHAEMFSYYEPTFGATIAARMCGRPTLNSGFFCMAAANPLWAEYRSEIERLFSSDADRYAPLVRHMAEQIALNVVAARDSRVTLVDPLYNYVCLWTPPFRDPAGVVRVALPPYAPIGIVHLAGGWQIYGATYFSKGLLYQSGSYLSAADKATLFPESRVPGCK